MMIQPCHRLFFALLPPRPQAEEIDRIGRWFGEVRSRVAVGRLHVTTNITGDYADYPAQLADQMVAAGNSVASQSFTIAMDRISGGNSSVALTASEPAHGLKDLQRRLELALIRQGVPLREGWRFNPHLTLLYRSGTRFRKAIEPIVWQALDFVLIHSWVGRTRQRLVERWPLRLAGVTLH